MATRANEKDKGSTSSGHGALGMGGQPSDDPRDEKGGSEGYTDDDRGGSGTGPVPGAFGSTQADVSGGSVAGVPGDNSMTEEVIKKVTKKN
jgi:hypothetical protein